MDPSAVPTLMSFNPAGRGSPLLAIHDLHVEFSSHNRTVRAVRGVSLEIHAGEAIGLVGESGSGKSVSALSILGLLPRGVGRVSSGSAKFEGRELIGMRAEELRQVRGAKIAMIFQDPMSSLNPVLTIGRQITETLEAHSGIAGRPARVRAIELLDLVGIPDPARRINDYSHQLSGGMRQRAMIAMALSGEPSLLIADEPTTALDVTIQAQILALLRRLRQELGMAILLITHDLGVVAGFADRLAVMYAGQLVEVGLTEAVLAHPSHPYTIGLLRCLPRLDKPLQEALTPIEGSPPDLAVTLPGCPFAPRCAWRDTESWETNPLLIPVRAADPRGGGGGGSHLVACHNQPTPEEANEGRPLREGFIAAPPPQALLSFLGSGAEPLLAEGLREFGTETNAAEMPEAKASAVDNARPDVHLDDHASPAGPDADRT